MDNSKQDYINSALAANANLVNFIKRWFRKHKPTQGDVIEPAQRPKLSKYSDEMILAISKEGIEVIPYVAPKDFDYETHAMEGRIIAFSEISTDLLVWVANKLEE